MNLRTLWQAATAARCTVKVRLSARQDGEPEILLPAGSVSIIPFASWPRRVLEVAVTILRWLSAKTRSCAKEIRTVRCEGVYQATFFQCFDPMQRTGRDDKTPALRQRSLLAHAGANALHRLRLLRSQIRPASIHRCRQRRGGGCRCRGLSRPLHLAARTIWYLTCFASPILPASRHRLERLRHACNVRPWPTRTRQHPRYHEGRPIVRPVCGKELLHCAQDRCEALAYWR
jgi:hypothetical protein